MDHAARQEFVANLRQLSTADLKPVLTEAMKARPQDE